MKKIFCFLKRDKHRKNEFDEYQLRLEYLQNRLEKVRQEFNIEVDPDKIEALVYEEKAIMIRLDHLLKTAKNLEVPESLRKNLILFR